ncbi:hypothetical protein A2U01_0072815 [Trifolium medium]|uniref:Uncharacterized protein n=1 Tax=Trifolium medium TaxID=97028 RepID=A0A392SRT1_9FABA|nr:hypothetical protein [Trifolium medium]
MPINTGARWPSVVARGGALVTSGRQTTTIWWLTAALRR